jgi:phosphate transport system protein
MAIAASAPETTALRALAVDFSQLAALVEMQLGEAINAFERRDIAAAERIVSADAKVDALNRQIDEKVLALLKTGPLPERGLREVVSYMKLAGELERVGDLAKNVAKRTLVVSREQPPQSSVIGVVRMGRASLRQLSDIISAFQSSSLSAAAAIWRGDSVLDELYNSLYGDLMRSMTEDPRKVAANAHLLFIAKNFERIGDHATNIAEAIHFVETGAPFAESRPKSDDTAAMTAPAKSATED